MGEISQGKKQKAKSRYITVIVLFIAVIASAQEGARYLIITHDNFYDCIQPLAQWKHQKGMMSKVVRLSEIGNTPDAIRNYIIQAYNNWPVKPEYLLLVGSPNFLSSYLDPVTRVYTDGYYADVFGDYQIEISYGRFSCRTPRQCSIMVNKSIFYEKNPFESGDSSWILKGTTVVREDNPPDPYYKSDTRHIRNLVLANGFVHTDSFLNLAGDDWRDVIDAVNKGRSFVVYRGGGVSNWGKPFACSINYCVNLNKLPIIVSATCQTMTLAPNESMVCEAWIRKGGPDSLTGAVAVLGTTKAAHYTSLYRGTVAKAFFDALFTQGLSSVGDALKWAKLTLYLLYPDRARYQEWNLLGDPELNFWTGCPKALAVTYPETISVGSQTITVTVEKEGVRLADALVCLWKEPDVYKYGYTNSLGEVSFNISPALPGEILLTVTARNSLPFEKSIICVPPTGMLEDSEERVKGRNYFLRERPLIYDAMGRRCPAVKKGVYFMEDKGGIRKLVILD